MTSDGGLFGSPRPDGPLPKLVVIGIAWAAFGVVALITALLMKSVGIAVFGVLCVLAGGGLYAGQRARERLEEDERSWRSDPGGYLDDLPEPDDEAADAADEERDGSGRPGRSDDEPGDDGGPPDPDREHATRVMSSSHDHDDIVDAEYTEYPEYEPSPSEQDDGTGYDDEETAYQRRRESEWARDGSRAREDDTEVIEADDRDDDEPDAPRDGDRGESHGDREGPQDRTSRETPR